MTNTRISDPCDPDFEFTGKTIAWKNDRRIDFSKLYNPTADAKRWDAVAADVLAVGSAYNCFSYIKLQVTGRKVVSIPGTGGIDGSYGVKAVATFNVGTEDEQTAEAWIVADCGYLCSKDEALKGLPSA